jgi:hypothetical protein
MRRRLPTLAAALVCVLAAVQVGGVVVHVASGDDAARTGLAAVPALLRADAPAERDVAVYEGTGAWVDLYDTGPGEGGRPPAVTPAGVDDLEAAGVRTLYLQVARDAGTGEPELHDPELAARFLVRAHARGLRVVGWYVPRFGDIERDLAHIEAIASFEVLGHRFDGVAVDIEWTGTVADDGVRSDRLVALSTAVRDELGSDALGAIVLPPVQLDVVNPAFWPGFPWDELRPLYDVWLPMGYWTDRTVASGYRDAATYTGENLRRLAELVGEDAPVHPIGGLGEETTPADLNGFVAALAARPDTVIGASIYDWATFPVDAQRRLTDALHRRAPRRRRHPRRPAARRRLRRAGRR